MVRRAVSCSSHMKWFLVPVIEGGAIPFPLGRREETPLEEIRPGVRGDTGERQLYFIAGKSWIGEEAAPTMPNPMDLYSTEDHGSHLPE